MENILQSDQLKIKILKALSDEKAYTYYALRKKTQSSYDTLKPNCNFLESLKLIKIIKISKEESATNTSYHSIKITSKGLNFIKNIK